MKVNQWTKSGRCETHNCVEVQWFKSSKSGVSECVEVAWEKPSRCHSEAHCVEVGSTPDKIFVRDSKKGEDSPILEFTLDAWRSFLSQFK